MFLITFEADNNDTFETKEHILYDCEDYGEGPEDCSMFWEKVPKDVKKRVKDTYDGVWVPDIKTIKIRQVKEKK